MRKSCFIAFFLAALMVFAVPSRSSAAQISLGISVHVGPPPIPVLAVQPIAPGPGYLWTPGYWAYGSDGYYWVHGTWVVAPVGMLWTPGYWGWGSGAYLWHAGYWGPHVGFYGGVHYGFGYEGVGYAGGRWDHGVFAYNTAVSHVNVTVIHNTYVDRTVVVDEHNVSRVSFNGGEGGIHAEPNRDERMAMNEHHQAPIAAQTQHEHAASMNHANFASENHGHPGNSFHPPAHGEEASHNEHVDHAANMNNGHQPENHQPENHANNAHNDHPHDNSHPQQEKNKDDRGGGRDNR